MKKLKTTADFLKLDVSTEQFLVPCLKIKLGFVTESIVKELKKRDEISHSVILEFRQQCNEILVEFISFFNRKVAIAVSIVQKCVMP